MNEWQVVRLDSVVEIQRTSVQPGRIRSGTTYVGLENMTSDGVFSNVEAVEAGELGSAKFTFTSEHLLYGKLRPYLSKIARPNFEGVCTTDIVPLRPGPKVDRSFLFHYLRLPLMVDKAASASVGINLPRLSHSSLASFQIPMPPIEDQRRIAAILDKADEIRTKRRAALAQLDTLTQAIFLDLFGDPVSNPRGWPDSAALGDVAEIVSGVTKGRSLEGKTVRSVPYLAVVNVQDKALDLSTVKVIDATADEIRRFRLKKGDLVLTEVGDPDKLGRGCLWDEELPECIHQNHIFRVRTHQGSIEPLFLNWLVGSARGKKYFLRSAKQTTGIASINMTQLKSFPLLMPPLAT